MTASNGFGGLDNDKTWLKPVPGMNHAHTHTTCHSIAICLMCLTLGLFEDVLLKCDRAEHITRRCALPTQKMKQKNICEQKRN